MLLRHPLKKSWMLKVGTQYQHRLKLQYQNQQSPQPLVRVTCTMHPPEWVSPETRHREMAFV